MCSTSYASLHLRLICYLPLHSSASQAHDDATAHSFRHRVLVLHTIPSLRPQLLPHLFHSSQHRVRLV